MANTKLLFLGSEKSETTEHSLVCYHNANNEIYINISMGNSDNDYAFICLDKQTAIKLHRELKKHISFLESEVHNV